jgi:hypothetical protein
MTCIRRLRTPVALSSNPISVQPDAKVSRASPRPQRRSAAGLSVDQKPSDDDLCVTSLWHPQVAHSAAAQFSRAVEADQLRLSEGFAAISRAKCRSTF